MFIYETRTIYYEDGSGPLQGIVVKKAEDATEWLPAEKDDVVVFLEEYVGNGLDDLIVHNVRYNPEFVVGEEPHPYLNVSLNDEPINNGDIVGDFTQSGYNFQIDSNIQDIQVSVDEGLQYYWLDNDLVVSTSREGEVTGSVTLSGNGVSISFTVNLYFQQPEE